MWNSMQFMLSTCIEYKEPLTAFWNRAFPDNLLLEDDWNNIEMYVDFLCTFMDATNSFCNVYEPTSLNFLGNVIHIAQLFNKYRGLDTYLGFISAMESKWLEYWTDIPYVYVFTIILDPRWKFEGAIFLVNIYKQLMCLNFDVEAYKDEIRTAFLTVFNHYESLFGNITRHSSHLNTASSSGGAFRGTTVSALKALISQLRPNIGQSAKASDFVEYHMYINYDYMRAYTDDEANVLDLLGWWRHQSKTLPVMSAMAKDFLSIQVSSVASERAFSTAKRVLDDKRTSMRSDTLRMCMCYKDWMDVSDRKQGGVDPKSANDTNESSTESNP
ncbi:zinc finger BED domain-containing protein DAYSLEEPER-like [Silene latifolia]|uniref:zinc finger BED domain-containing protein DAYSLEEPER-like n=1 Tax=Silene latifolia TaxID=37657 RepID=UPI003D77786D